MSGIGASSGNDTGCPDPGGRFSAVAQLTLETAQREAASFKHSYIGTEHLLLGLAAVEQGTAARALIDLGIDYRLLRDTLTPVIGSGQSSSAAARPLTARAEASIDLATREAEHSDHGQITTGDVLLGILTEGENVAAAILNSIGVDVATARSKVREITDRNGRE